MTNTPEFKIGQKVVTRRNMGTAPGNEADNQINRYYHGVSLSEVPLGSKGTIIDTCKRHYVVEFRGESYCFEAKELILNRLYLKEQKREEERFISALETKLAKESVDKSGSKNHKFNPQFNVREEFVVWIDREFPNLKNHIENGNRYRAFEKRKKEVYKAAMKACEHGVDTTRTCVRSFFVDWKIELNESCTSYELAQQTYRLVKFIKNISANLNEGERHYGTVLRSKG